MLRLNLILHILTLSLAASAQSLEYDGPYIQFEGADTVAYWAHADDGRKGRVALNGGGAALTELPEIAGFHPESVKIEEDFKIVTDLRFRNVSRVAAISDIHGQYETAHRLLHLHGIIDEYDNWIYGDGHLVIVGDVFDRGDQVTATLWLIYHLQQEAPKYGGQVHFLLGNHETMVMEGDVRYINPKYLASTTLLQIPYQDLYGPDSFLGRWLRSLPLTVRINDAVFVHGGFSPRMIRSISSIDEINRVYHRELMGMEATISAMKSERLELLHGKWGPLWYRGYFQDRDFGRRDIDRVLKRLEAEHLVVGHTSFIAIKSFFDGRVYAVDSSIKFGSLGELLLIEDGQFMRGTLTGEVLPIEGITK